MSAVMAVAAWLGMLLLSSVITGLARRYALRRAMLDIPNQRSSHAVPTPRGGGVSIAIVILLAATLLTIVEWLPRATGIAFIAGGGIVAAIGWMDDHRHVAARWRAAAHLAAAACALACFGGLPAISLGSWQVEIGLTGTALGMLAIGWLVNLYNFMDGTDGLAASQGICAGTAGAVLLWLSGSPGLAALSAAAVAGAAGFLVWNWPPARIFMGDVGSCSLGFLFGALAVAGERAGTLPALTWIILLAPFIGDASWTLASRVLRGEAWYTAHREHAYQRLVQMGWSHGKVMAAAIAVNIAVLWPAAALTYALPDALLPVTLTVLLGTWVLWRQVWRRSAALAAAGRH